MTGGTMSTQLNIPVTCEDPLLVNKPFSRSITLFPLGFPLRIETNSDEVIEVALASWSMFSPAFSEGPVLLSVGVSDGPATSLPPAPTLRSRGHLLSIVSDAENFFMCDFSRGYQFGWVSQIVANHPTFFRYHFLEAAALTTIQQRYLAPIHGACVARNGQGVVFCGPSSAGKSTLAYACGRSGWTFISDDATFLVRSGPDRQAVGNCHSIRFRESTKRLFPELFHLTSSIRGNGTSRIETLTRNLSIATSPSCTVGHIVFLNRSHSGPARLRRVSGERAMDWFLSFAFYGEGSVRTAQMECYRKLLAGDIWELQYCELDDALSLLERLGP